MARSNIDVHWDEFCDWCEDSGVGDPRYGTPNEDWKPWFECWGAALDAREAAEAEGDE